MPLYEYVCETCSNDFEKLMRLSDPTPVCPECGAANVKKKVSAAAFSLKGGGWYKDGYTGPSNKSSEKKETKSSGGSAESGSSAASSSSTSASSGSASAGSAKSSSAKSSGDS